MAEKTANEKPSSKKNVTVASTSNKKEIHPTKALSVTHDSK